ncbi:MAG TPA: hypothetical protein VN757_01735 [Steroidobacteraceae bacterium]|nr:hypothetical protein [Steroidobacteraceae bacterium]
MMKPGNVAIIAACVGNLLESYDLSVLTRFTRQANGSAMAPAAYVMSAAFVALLTMPFFERRRAAAGTAASQVPA